ncbi:MAG: M24 family metallopeptidase [bacterium]|nr:M24 family metallopeptidase [bacterium]
MNRLQEIEAKHALVRAILDKHNADALYMLKTRNIAWFTAGMDASIPVDTEFGMYGLLITREKRVIVTPNIEAPRIRDEDQAELFGFELKAHDWYGPDVFDQPGFFSDYLPPIPAGASYWQSMIVSDSQVEADLFAHRIQLMEPEQARYRALGFDAAQALESAIRAVRPGDSEWQVAARLDAACRERGGAAVVNLVAADDRISRYRHPLVTDQQVEKVVMIVLCMRRGGLIVAATRFAHIGSVPAALREKARRVAHIDAAAMIASRPGRTLGAVFADIQAAYAAVGEDGQWQHHHQGGLIAYNGRERVAKPGDATVIPVGGACAWNPSIVGFKSEDTILIGENGFEMVTEASGDYPRIDVEIDGHKIARPGILEL